MDTNATGGKLLLPVAVIAAGLLIAGAVLWNGSRAPAGDQGAAAVAVDAKKVNTDGAPYIGDANAPVTVIFWSDFQCPYCKQFETGGVPALASIVPAFPDLLTNYVNTGKVKIVFMDFPFLGQDSIDAAMYNHSIWKLYPEKYLQWRTAMYQAQDDEGDKGFGDAASIDKLDATIAGLDAGIIAADVKQNGASYRATADAEKSEGAKVGVNSTPSFIAGTKLIVGAYPYATFQAAIDEALK